MVKVSLKAVAVEIESQGDIDGVRSVMNALWGGLSIGVAPAPQEAARGEASETRRLASPAEDPPARSVIAPRAKPKGKPGRKPRSESSTKVGGGGGRCQGCAIEQGIVITRVGDRAGRPAAEVARAGEGRARRGGRDAHRDHGAAAARHQRFEHLRLADSLEGPGGRLVLPTVARHLRAAGGRVMAGRAHQRAQ